MMEDEYVNFYGQSITVGSIVRCTTAHTFGPHRGWGIVEALHLNPGVLTARLRDLDGHVADFPLEVLRTMDIETVGS